MRPPPVPGPADLAAGRRYSAATVARWRALPPRDAEALGRLVAELRPSENQLRDLWEWLADIATRDGTSLAALLERDPLASVWRRPAARTERLTALKAALRRLRYPELARAEAALAAHVAALGLPRGVRVEFPEFLEGDEVRITFAVRNPAAWAATAQALLDAAADPHCAALFALLADPPGPEGSPHGD